MSRPLKAQPVIKPSSTPMLMEISVRLTSAPRTRLGDSSAMYSGAMVRPVPTPTPVTTRPMMSIS